MLWSTPLERRPPIPMASLEAERLSLQWDQFQMNQVDSGKGELLDTSISCFEYQVDSYKRMRKATDFSDITLACEDGRQIYAHRIILASSSSFFQKVLTKVMHSHPLIFLKGVTHSHLSAIMDFIYLGQAEIQEKDVDAFVEVATDLGIKGITEQGTEAKERQAMRSVTPANAPADVDETDPGF